MNVNNRSMTESDILKILHKRASGGTQLALAHALDVAPSYLSMVLTGKRGVSARLAKALGYHLTVQRTAVKVFTPIL